MLSTVIFWIGRAICHRDLLLATGINPKGEVMMKIIQMTGNLDVFRGLITSHIIRLMPSGNVILTRTQNMINFGMPMAALKTMVIQDMINLPGLAVMTMTIHMMIMATSPVFLIIVGRIAMRGIMSMVGIVMILIMKEVVEEIVIGGGANPVIENVIEEVLVGKEI